MYFIKKFFPIILSLVVIFNMLFLFVSSKRPVWKSVLNSTVLTVTGPIQEYTSKFLFFLTKMANRYIFLLSVVEKNKFLKEQLESNNRISIEYSKVKLTNSRLRELLELKEKVLNCAIAAEVIAEDSSPVSQTVIINKGKTDGILEKSPVVVNDGIVGLVTEVSDKYSRVLLITDLRSSVDGFIQVEKIRCVVSGNGNNSCGLEYISKKKNIKIGEVVVSSGLDGVFPKGLSIGIISSVFHDASGFLQKVQIEPFVDFKFIQEVLVLTPKYKCRYDF